MRLKFVLIFISFLPFILGVKFIHATNYLDIVINEIAWMGTQDSYSNEWIELYNAGPVQVDLSGWKLIAQDGVPEINLIGTIPPKAFYLLERTNDDSVPSIIADQIYTGALSNEGEYLQLFDGQNNLIDELNCSSGWFAGDNSTKQTMERRDSQIMGNSSSNWQFSQNPGGTPKAKNSVLRQEELTENGSLQVESEKVPEVGPLAATNYPSGVGFSEILPSPEGPDAENEWVEIANENNFEVDLKGWKISDIIGSTHAYTFSENTTIKANGFLVLGRPETKITLNNSGDRLNLIRPDNLTADTLSYEKAPLGQSYSLKNGQWVWSTILTPGSTNKLIVPKKPEDNRDQPSVFQDNFQDKTEVSSREIFEELAAIKEQIPENIEFLSVAIIALFLALFSGGIFLFLKSKLHKINNRF